MKHFYPRRTLVYLAVMVVCASLAGCPTPIPKPNVDTTQETKFDKRLIKDCEPLPTLVSARENDVQEWSIKVLKVHSDCATLKAKENAEIVKALNIKAEEVYLTP